MSVQMICDCCKKEITEEEKRVELAAIQIFKGEIMEGRLYHFRLCPECFSIKPSLEGKKKEII